MAHWLGLHRDRRACPISTRNRLPLRSGGAAGHTAEAALIGSGERVLDHRPEDIGTRLLRLARQRKMLNVTQVEVASRVVVSEGQSPGRVAKPHG